MLTLFPSYSLSLATLVSSPLPPLCSFRTFDTGGFVAVILPFISTRFLPEERGTSDAVTDFRKFAVSRTAHGNAAAADGAGAGGTHTITACGSLGTASILNM